MSPIAETTTQTCASRLRGGDDALRDAPDPLRARDGGAAVLLDDERHVADASVPIPSDWPDTFGHGTMDADDKLRLDYEQTTQLMRTLTDIRFKLLAFVPTIAGASVGLVGRGQPASVLLGVGCSGSPRTVGILLYELRNGQIFDAVVERAAMLEQKLGLGLFRDRPSNRVTLFGFVAARHDRGLGLVYGGALAAGPTWLLGERFGRSTLAARGRSAP